VPVSQVLVVLITQPQQFWVFTKHIERGRISETISRDFCRQQDAMRVFKQCLEHDNIMLSWTTFSHGANFVIISPLADLNLHNFLTGRYEDFDVRHHRFTPLDLLRAISGVADALEFLHLRLNLRGRKIACAHVDLRPENILIQWELNGERLSVGRWLLKDFDIARIKESSEDPGPLAPADFLTQFSLVKLQNNSTSFSAPESTTSAPQRVGSERDMWSFGCLLALVLVFAVGGPSLVDSFTKSKDSTQLGRASTEYFYMVEDGKAVLKPGVMNWLNSLRIESSERRWMGRVLDLVFGMIVEVPSDRLNAHQAQEKLQLIWHEEQRFIKNRCLWISPEAPIAVDPESHPRVPDDGLIPIYTPESSAPQSKPAFEVEGLIPVNSEDHHYPSGQIPSTPIDDRRGSSSTGYSMPCMGIGQSSYSTIDDRRYSMGIGQSSYSTSDWKSSFVCLITPPRPVRSLICGGRYASLSRHTAIVHSFGPEDRWSYRAPKSPGPLQQGSIAPQNIQCPPGFAEWDLASLCSDYIILRAKNNNELKVSIGSTIFLQGLRSIS
jgi:serine/threonine protein kinase